MSFNLVKSVEDYYPIMERLLDAGVAMVHLIPGLLGVKVPAQFRSEPILRLNFSYRFGIDDFQVDARGVRASLSFGGVNHFCDIPWGAVIAISSQVLGEKYVCAENFSVEQLSLVISPMEAVQVFRDYQEGKYADICDDIQTPSDKELVESTLRLLNPDMSPDELEAMCQRLSVGEENPSPSPEGMQAILDRLNAAKKDFQAAVVRGEATIDSEDDEDDECEEDAKGDEDDGDDEPPKPWGGLHLV